MDYFYPALIWILAALVRAGGAVGLVIVLQKSPSEGS